MLIFLVSECHWWTIYWTTGWWIISNCFNSIPFVTQHRHCRRDFYYYFILILEQEQIHNVPSLCKCIVLIPLSIILGFLFKHFLWSDKQLTITPIMAMGCRQCLPFSVVQLKGKHCSKPNCRNRVVHTFGHWDRSGQCT